MKSNRAWIGVQLLVLWSAVIPGWFAGPSAQAALFGSRLAVDNTPAPALESLDVPIPQAPAVAAYAQGLDLIERGRFAEAITPLTQAVDGDEENADYLLARGVALILSEKITEGRKDLERAYRLRPKDTDTRRMLAFALRLQGDELGAPRYYSNGSTDPYDEFLLKTGNDYGAYVHAANVPSPQYQAEVKQRHQQALEQFPNIGLQFARAHKTGENIGRALFGRGVQRFTRGDYAGAEQDFLSVLQEFPDDYTSLYYHGSALIHENRLEQGRQEMSTVLSWKPALVEGYCQRAIGAARMGDLPHAERDLQIAERLDPKDSRKARAEAEKVLAECNAKEPKTSSAQLYDGLMEGARAKEPFDKLLQRAEQLLLAGNAHRTNGDEVYQERRRELAWALAAEPRNPDRLAALGKFLADEADVRGECVEPNGQWVRYRAQSARLQNNELAYARQLFDEALKINPKHIPSLIGLAGLEIRNLQWSNAETILRRALQIRDDVPEMLELMSRVMQEAADQKSAKAANLREVKTWNEYGYNVIWHYTRYPSLAERDRADQYDAQANRLMDFSRQYFQRALKACAGTEQGFYYQGVLDWNNGDVDGARQAMEQAAKLAPQDRRVHYSLANIYAKLNQVDASIEQQTIAENLEQTTAAPWLQRAWSKIVNNAWKTSKAALVKAREADPEDSRVPAYEGTIAQGEEHTDQAAADYWAALAIEEARAHQRGTTYAGGTGTWPPNDFGRSIALRLRLGQMLQAQAPAEAAKLFLENVALEDRITEWGFSAHVQTAMLPDPKQDLTVTPSPPIAVALLRKSRALAGIALTHAGKYKEAVAQFERLGGYEKRLRGGGTAYLDWGDDVSKAPATALAMAEAYDGAGDPFRAYGALMGARQHFQINWQGKQDPQYGEYKSLQAKVEEKLCSAYNGLVNQALSAIRSAPASEREQVRSGWEQKLRPIYTNCEQCFQEHQIRPPWEMLSSYALSQSNLPWNQGQLRSQPQNQQQWLQQQQQSQQQWQQQWQQQQKQIQQQRQAQLDFQNWMQQELQRIRQLPADQQPGALQDLQRQIQQRQAQVQQARPN
jgi:predicted Zn-dependent protease